MDSSNQFSRAKNHSHVRFRDVLKVGKCGRGNMRRAERVVFDGRLSLSDPRSGCPRNRRNPQTHMPTSHLKPLAILSLLAGVALSNASSSFLKSLPPSPILNASTVPSNGDVNPYGVAYVPTGFPQGGKLKAGDILVSNFNNGANLQGTGTTIVSISQSGTQQVSFQGQGLGLTTALGVLRGGYVLIGSVPTSDGTASTISQGSLIVLENMAIKYWLSQTRLS